MNITGFVNLLKDEIIMEQQIGFTQTVQVGCGIDVHQSVIVATVSPGQSRYETREFEAYTNACCHGVHGNLLEAGLQYSRRKF